MKTYTLKLRTNNGRTYAPYDGETQLSDSDLTTLFGSAGEAYFVFDYGTYTPGTTTEFDIVNSQGNIEITSRNITGLQMVEGVNYKGVWEVVSGVADFTSFTQLPAYGLDESQLGELASLAKSGKIRTLTTADYNYHATGSTDDSIGPWLLDAGYYITEPGLKIYNSAGGSYSTHPNSVIIIVSKRSDWSQVKCLIASGGLWTLWGTDLTGGSASQTILGVVDGLTGAGVSGPYVALSANQGKVLNNNIGDLSTLTTTAKTSTVAAINELVGSIGNIAPLTGSSAPTSSTVGEIGQIYVDTTNDKVYILKQIIEESGADDEYVWEELGGGGGNYDVFTTNEWNALWS